MTRIEDTTWDVVVNDEVITCMRYTLPPVIGQRLMVHDGALRLRASHGPRLVWRVLMTGDRICDRLITCLGYDQEHIIPEQERFVPSYVRDSRIIGEGPGSTWVGADGVEHGD